MAIHARLQHISIPRPPGSEEKTRAFYGRVLGLPEIPVPRSIAHLDLIWFQLGDLELHVFAEKPVNDPSGRHFCLVVDDLQEMRTRLESAGYTIEEPLGIPGRPRFFCHDPFNNRIEFTHIEGNYQELEK